MPSVPEDLLLCVLDALPETTSPWEPTAAHEPHLRPLTSALYRCTLVSRSFRTIAEPLLYRRAYAAAEKQLRRLAARLERRDLPPVAVRELHVRMGCEDANGRTTSYKRWRKTVRRVCAVRPSLETLNLTGPDGAPGGYWDVSWVEPVADSLKCLALSRLALAHFPQVADIQLIALRRLRIKRCSIWGSEPDTARRLLGQMSGVEELEYQEGGRPGFLVPAFACLPHLRCVSIKHPNRPRPVLLTLPPFPRTAKSHIDSFEQLCVRMLGQELLTVFSTAAMGSAAMLEPRLRDLSRAVGGAASIVFDLADLVEELEKNGAPMP